ncbi:ABC transporter permease subunit [Actinoplanes sp. TBRC 11911]|uniref:ABC transporter permease n=1 Tax=Actinoplanes sp. TBRC 11911 TaxID=2729386 RepID=UPI00145D951D|nr:ABC transporter permease subunit [Actinoplanes sp. TBRC 11911]NMO50106.1 ABC transporter permease subunit [Actinoplanes sp. TBRC 11911]
MSSDLPGFASLGRWLNDPDNWLGSGGLLAHLREHLAFTVVIVLVAALIAIPAGIWMGHTGKGILLAGGFANALRAVPALGLLILLIVELSPHIHSRTGVGNLLAPGALPYFIPAALVLVILAVPPMLTNTYAGIQAVDPRAADAARGAGMSPLQVALRVEIPCAMPLILAGLRSATLQVIASLTVAAYAPLVGGLGRLIVDGQQNLIDPSLGYPAMLGAGITVAVLALVADGAFALAGRYVISPGVSGRRIRGRGTAAPQQSTLTES